MRLLTKVLSATLGVGCRQFAQRAAPTRLETFCCRQGEDVCCGIRDGNVMRSRNFASATLSVSASAIVSVNVGVPGIR